MRPAWALLLLAGLSSPALACDCLRLDPDHPRFASDLDRIAPHLAVVAEGIMEADGPYTWRFRPMREYRGPGQASYSVELISDCSLSPDEMKEIIGKRVFLLLAAGTGGPATRYEASRCINLLGADVEAALRARFTRACPRR